jgi:hypothetical protein
MRLTVHAWFGIWALCSFVFLGVGCRVSATPGTAPSGDGAPGNANGDAPDDDATSGLGGTSSKSSGGTTGGSKTSGSGGTSSKATGGSSTNGTATGGSSANGTATGGSANGSANGSSTSGSSSSGSSSPSDDTSGAANASGSVGNGGSPPDSDSSPGSTSSSGCDAQSVSFDEIRAGTVRSDVEVRVDATATSQKFLLSHAHSGSCLFGAFVGVDPDADGPHGVLVVSYGDDAADGDACPLGTDAIPDDLAPGDVVRTVGYLGSYAPSGCTVTPSPQLMVDRACPVARSGRRSVPKPFVLPLDDADALAQGTDSARVRRFAGGLVRLEDVSAQRADDGTGSVAPYGVITFNETALELHNDLEYGDLSLGGPGDAQKSLEFAYPTDFASVTGVVYLDYCTWSLAPRSRCSDLVPPSANCR